MTSKFAVAIIIIFIVLVGLALYYFNTEHKFSKLHHFYYQALMSIHHQLVGSMNEAVDEGEGTELRNSLLQPESVTLIRAEYSYDEGTHTIRGVWNSHLSLCDAMLVNTVMNDEAQEVVIKLTELKFYGVCPMLANKPYYPVFKISVEAPPDVVFKGKLYKRSATFLGLFGVSGGISVPVELVSLMES